MDLEQLRDRIKGLCWGIVAGDAAAMPVHWFYAPGSIERDLGGPITGYIKPPFPHKDSFVHSMTYSPDPTNPIDIIQEGRAVVQETSPPPEERKHYHGNLQAGEATLNVTALGLVLSRVLTKLKRYDADTYLSDFKHFMTTAKQTNDTYRDVFLRRMFEKHSYGAPLAKSAPTQYEVWSVGSTAGLIGPSILAAFDVLEANEDLAIQRAVDHHKLTHNSENVEISARVLVPLLRALLRSNGNAKELIQEASQKLKLPVTDGPTLLRYYNEYKGPSNIPKDIMYKLHTEMKEERFSAAAHVGKADSEVIGRGGFLSTACYTEHSFPAALYLSYKYCGDVGAALCANANALGDSTSRGSIIGAILGAVHGAAAMEDSWVVRDLHNREALDAEISAFADAVVGRHKAA